MLSYYICSYYIRQENVSVLRKNKLMNQDFIHNRQESVNLYDGIFFAFKADCGTEG